MAGSTLGIGVSGLIAAQRQLATTSHNISNVNTQGYTRQRAEQAARYPQYSGNGYIGTGVNVETTMRVTDEFLESQIRNSNSQLGQYDAFYALSAQIDNVLANPDSGLAPTMESFFSALQEANDNPSSLGARQVLLTEAKTMTERFQLLDNRFEELNDQVNQQLIDLTKEVSEAALSVAQLNRDIVNKIGIGQGNLPNDLLDQREELIKKISENIDVKVVYQDDGAANLFIGTGQSLVVGSITAGLSTRVSDFNTGGLDIILTQGTGSVDITNAVSGGELQGVLDFRENVLDPGRRSLGRVAIAMSEEMNAQHRLGMTIQGNSAPYSLGQDFFLPLNNSPQVLDGQPVSTASYTSAITNSKILSASDYRLDVSGGGTNYVLTRLSDNTEIYNGAYAGLDAQAQLTEGFSISGGPSTADEKFLIRPTFTASKIMDVAVNNVVDIALAAPVVSGAVTDATGGALNSGTGEVSLPSIGTIAGIPLVADISLTFDAINGDGLGGPGFVVVGGPVANLAFDPATEYAGKTFNFPGVGDMSFEISGQPVTGDAFVISNNEAPFDDNRNGLLMAQLQTAKTIDNGSTSFQSGYALIVTNVGTQTHSAEVDLKAQTSLNEQANATRNSFSGVNLDEEAADLLKFQQAYQASARVISAADEMFQALLGAT